MNEIKKMNDREMENVVGGITQEEALLTALQHAGLTRDQLDYVKRIEMDYEHGRQIYEISFYKGGFEYEYDIDAVSGAILKCEKDWD